MTAAPLERVCPCDSPIHNAEGRTAQPATESAMNTARQPRTPRAPRRCAILQVGSEELAALLRLPDDVTIGGFALDPLRDSVSFLLDSERFYPVEPGFEPLRLLADVTVEYGDDGSVTQRVTWSALDHAGFEIRHQRPADEASPE
jgi:hypothetical protein